MMVTSEIIGSLFYGCALAWKYARLVIFCVCSHVWLSHICNFSLLQWTT